MSKVRAIVCVFAVLMLTGCTLFDTYKGVVKDNSTKAADDSLKVSAWLLCEASSTGAVRRKFNTPEKIQAYDDLCALFTLPL